MPAKLSDTMIAALVAAYGNRDNEGRYRVPLETPRRTVEALTRRAMVEGMALTAEGVTVGAKHAPAKPHAVVVDAPHALYIDSKEGRKLAGSSLTPERVQKNADNARSKRLDWEQLDDGTVRIETRHYVPQQQAVSAPESSSKELSPWLLSRGYSGAAGAQQQAPVCANVECGKPATITALYYGSWSPVCHFHSYAAPTRPLIVEAQQAPQGVDVFIANLGRVQAHVEAQQQPAVSPVVVAPHHASYAAELLGEGERWLRHWYGSGDDSADIPVDREGALDIIVPALRHGGWAVYRVGVGGVKVESPTGELSYWLEPVPVEAVSAPQGAPEQQEAAEVVDQDAGEVQSCRSVEGVTVGLVDAIIGIVRVLAPRDMSAQNVQDALSDLFEDSDFASVRDAWHGNGEPAAVEAVSAPQSAQEGAQRCAECGDSSFLARARELPGMPALCVGCHEARGTDQAQAGHQCEDGCALDVSHDGLCAPVSAQGATGEARECEECGAAPGEACSPLFTCGAPLEVEPQWVSEAQQAGEGDPGMHARGLAEHLVTDHGYDYGELGGMHNWPIEAQREFHEQSHGPIGEGVRVRTAHTHAAPVEGVPAGFGHVGAFIAGRDA